MGCCFEGDVSEVWAAMRRIQRSHKTEERPMTESLGPQESWPWGLQGSKPSAWVFFFHLENQAEKQSLFPRVVMETKGHNVYTAPRAERTSPLTARGGSQDFDTWTI